jgi:hypothetical protein
MGYARTPVEQVVDTEAHRDLLERVAAVLFDGPLRYITPLLWLAFAASSITMYFFVTWGPIVFEQMGLSRSSAAWSSSFNALVGATGAVTLMRFTDRLGPASLAVMPVLAVPLRPAGDPLTKAAARCPPPAAAI